MRMSRLLPLAFVLAALLVPMRGPPAHAQDSERSAVAPARFLRMIEAVVAMGELRRSREVERLTGATFATATPTAGLRFTDEARPAAPWALDYQVWHYGVALKLRPERNFCVTFDDVRAAFGGGFERYSGRVMLGDGTEAATGRESELFALRYSVFASPPPTYVHFAFHYRRCLVEAAILGGQQAHPAIDR